jgi:hypothetical protein
MFSIAEFSGLALRLVNAFVSLYGMRRKAARTVQNRQNGGQKLEI